MSDKLLVRRYQSKRPGCWLTLLTCGLWAVLVPYRSEEQMYQRDANKLGREGWSVQNIARSGDDLTVTYVRA